MHASRPIGMVNVHWFYFFQVLLDGMGSPTFKVNMVWHLHLIHFITMHVQIYQHSSRNTICADVCTLDMRWHVTSVNWPLLFTTGSASVLRVLVGGSLKQAPVCALACSVGSLKQTPMSVVWSQIVSIYSSPHLTPVIIVDCTSHM